MLKTSFCELLVDGCCPASTAYRTYHQRGPADRIAGSKYPRLTCLVIVSFYVIFLIELQAQILDYTFGDHM